MLQGSIQALVRVQRTAVRESINTVPALHPLVIAS